MFRLVLFFLVVLPIVYFCIALYSKAVRRGKLEAWYQESDKSVDLDTYVDRGMSKYERSLRYKLIWLVFIIPLVLIVTLVYIMNFM